MRDSQNRLILTKADTVLAWGNEEDLKKAFTENLHAISQLRLPISVQVAKNHNIKGFIERAISLAISRNRPLLVRNRRYETYLIAKHDLHSRTALAPILKHVGSASGEVPGLFSEPDDQYPESAQVRWSEPLRVVVNESNGRLWLQIQPDFWVWPPRSRKDARDFLQQRRSKRFNQKYNELLDAWIQVLFGNQTRGSEVEVTPHDSGDELENPLFRIGVRTAYSRRLLN